MRLFCPESRTSGFVRWKKPCTPGHVVWILAFYTPENVENPVETVKNPPFYRPFSGGKFRPFSPRFSTGHLSIQTEKGGFCHPAAFSEYLFTARRRCGNPGWRGRGSPARSSRGSCPSRRSARRCGSQTSCRSGRRPPRRFPDACRAARGPAP